MMKAVAASPGVGVDQRFVGQQITIQRKSDPECMYVRPMTDILVKYPDSLLATLVKDMLLVSARPDEVTGMKTLVFEFEPSALAIVLHVHAHGTLVGAPLPAGCQLAWLREVLQFYRLPDVVDLPVLPSSAGVSRGPVLQDHSLGTLVNLHVEAALGAAVQEVLNNLNTHKLLLGFEQLFLLGMDKTQEHKFKLCVLPCSTFAQPLPTMPARRRFSISEFSSKAMAQCGGLTDGSMVGDPDCFQLQRLPGMLANHQPSLKVALQQCNMVDSFMFTTTVLAVKFSV